MNKELRDIVVQFLNSLPEKSTGASVNLEDADFNYAVSCSRTVSYPEVYTPEPCGENWNLQISAWPKPKPAEVGEMTPIAGLGEPR